MNERIIAQGYSSVQLPFQNKLVTETIMHDVPFTTRTREKAF